MLKEKLNEIIEYAAKQESLEEIQKARIEYQQVAGNIFEDDKSYENHMASFLEWYTFDRLMTGNTLTPFLAFIAHKKQSWPSETLSDYISMTNHIHAIFIVKKVKKDYVVVINLFDNTKHKVWESESEIIFRKNDIFEGRTLPYQGKAHFTGAYCFHPKETLAFIKSGIKRLEQELQRSKAELKEVRAEKEKIIRKIEKSNSKLSKLNLKIQKSRSIMKTNSLEEKRDDLEKIKKGWKNQRAALEEKEFALMAAKIEQEATEARNKLMQKFSNMSLKWERFRHIDLKDIYKN